MPGSRIKGITVEIGGDTTKLQTAAEHANTALANGDISQKQYSSKLFAFGSTGTTIFRFDKQR